MQKGQRCCCLCSSPAPTLWNVSDGLGGTLGIVALTGWPLIAVLIALVLVVSFKRKTPRALELAAWVTLVLVCVLTIASNGNPQARALTTDTVWGAGRIVGMISSVSWQATSTWLHGDRFAIANVAVLVFAVDVFALALVSSRRKADAWIPVSRLGDWMVLPRLSAVEARVAAPSAIDGINRRFNSWVAAAAPATLAWSILLFNRWRTVDAPRVALGLREFSLVAATAWRRVAGGRAQVGEVRIARVIALSTDAVPRTTRTKRARAKRPATGPNIVPIKPVRKRVAGAKAGATTRKPRKRAAAAPTQHVSRIDKNGSAKRPDRLAS